MLDSVFEAKLAPYTPDKSSRKYCSIASVSLFVLHYFKDIPRPIDNNVHHGKHIAV